MSTAFVPNGDSRQDTAVLLIGTAEEHGIDSRLVKAVSGGFTIPEALADVLYSEGTKKKASGNRAAKNDSTKKE